MYKKLFIWVILFLLIDQVSKGLINLNMDLNQSIGIIPNFFNLTYVHNEGAAFSILMGGRWFFIIAAIIALNIIFIFFIKDKKLKTIETITYALLIAGIIGNLIDRVLYGYVIDFLDFNIFGYDFAIFNLADSFIVIAVIMLIILLIDKKKCKN